MAKKDSYKRVETWEDVGMLVDLAILKMLPKAGSTVGRYKEFGLPVNELHRRLEDPEISKTMVSGRISSLSQLELVISVRIFPTSAGRGWQITKKGEGVLKKHGDKLNPENGG